MPALEASAIFEAISAAGWIGDEPTDRNELRLPLGQAVPSHWHDVEIDRPLNVGIRVSAERRGLTTYDFEHWAPGCVHRPRGQSVAGKAVIFPTLGQVSEWSKPALVNRLRVINSHLILLHGAAMKVANESPPVYRVFGRDLLMGDYAEGSGDLVWYDHFGQSVPDTVVAADRHRQGSISDAVFDQSLTWLDSIVQHDRLIEFDLLNQAYTAAATHDYALATVAGWTVCELEIRRRAHAYQLDANRSNVGQLVTALATAGHIDGQLAAGLQDLRKARNSWLHAGHEPTEATSQNALRLTVEMLTAYVPGLITRHLSLVLL